jgi:DNA-binding LytR/AlgR family response regulator
MKVEIQIDDTYEENKIIVQAKEMNEEISNLIQKLSNKYQETFKVYLEEETYFIKEEDIESVYSMDGKVYIQTVNSKYQTRKRLYEFENLLPKNKFVRISNSEIVNFEKVEKINTKLLGTICINFFSGHQTYVSRRYVSKIKEFLGV